jgi:hypothetical protein
MKSLRSIVAKERNLNFSSQRLLANELLYSDYNQILYTVLAGVSIWKHCVHRALPQLCQDTCVTTGKQILVILFLYWC